MPTPADALRRLREGNARFVAGTPLERSAPDTVRATAHRQRPYAAVLSCIDSRVPIETVFDLAIGQAFGARTAGNVVNGDTLGALEYACALGGARIVVVLGHTGCGAIQGACDGVELGHLTALLAKIQPVVRATPSEGARDSTDAAFVDAVAEGNVRQVVGQVLSESPVLRARVGDGALAIVGAMYDVGTGRVRFLADAT